MPPRLPELLVRGELSPPAVDWAAAEKRLGVGLPSDYTAFVEKYGAGSINGFLWVLVPGLSNPNLNLLHELEGQRAALREFAEMLPMPPLPHSPDELIPWGITDNGDGCFWVATGSDPDQWGVTIVESRVSEWEDYPMGFCDFIDQLVRRVIVSGIFESDWLGEPPEFQPWNPEQQGPQ